MRLLFKGGTVVTGKGPRRADILVEGEKILDVCRDIPAIGAQVVDVTGMLLFPGFIDAHTHFDLDVCNTTTADDVVGVGVVHHDIGVGAGGQYAFAREQAIQLSLIHI